MIRSADPAGAETANQRAGNQPTCCYHGNRLYLTVLSRSSSCSSLLIISLSSPSECHAPTHTKQHTASPVTMETPQQPPCDVTDRPRLLQAKLLPLGCSFLFIRLERDVTMVTGQRGRGYALQGGVTWVRLKDSVGPSEPAEPQQRVLTCRLTRSGPVEIQMILIGSPTDDLHHHDDSLTADPLIGSSPDVSISSSFCPPMLSL